MSQKKYHDTLEEITKEVESMPDNENKKIYYALLNIAEILLSECDKSQITIQEQKAERNALLLKKS